MTVKIQFRRPARVFGFCLASICALASFFASAQTPASSTGAPTTLPAQTSSRSLVAGRDYLVLAKPVSAPDDRLEVAYFFWYNSPASAKFDPVIRNWAATKASPFVKLRPMPAVLENKWGYGARVFFALQLLNREHDLGPKLMQALDQGVVDYNSPKSLSAWIGEQGVSMSAMNKAINDPRVIAQTSWMPSIMRLYGVERVPTVLIDGQFLFVQDEKEKPADFMSKISFAAEALTQRKLKALANTRKEAKK